MVERGMPHSRPGPSSSTAMITVGSLRLVISSVLPLVLLPGQSEQYRSFTVQPALLSPSIVTITPV